MPIREFTDDMTMGAGYDPSSGRVRGSAIKRGPLHSAIHDTPGQQVSAVMQQVESFTSFQESMGIDMAMKVRGLIAKGDAKLNFSRQTSFSTYSVNLLVSTRIKNHPRAMYLDEVKLLPEARTLMRDKPDEFAKRFGTEFIAGEVTGGELFGLVQITTSDASERSELSSKIGFRSIAFSGDMAFKQEMETLTQGKQLTITCFRSGGVVKNPKDIVEMVTLFQELPLVVEQKPWVYNVITRGYDELLDSPSELPVALLRKRQDSLSRLTTYYFDYEQTMKDLDFIVSHKDQFPNFKPENHKNYRDKIEEQQKKILDVITSCTDAAPEKISSACRIDSTILHPEMALPALPTRIGGDRRHLPKLSISARDPDWQNTNTDVQAGQPITIQVISGDWTVGGGNPRTPGSGMDYSGPDRLLVPDARLGALVARIAGDPGEMFEVGERRENYIPATSGSLQLACNDGQHPNGYRDNDGTLQVRITLGAPIAATELHTASLMFAKETSIV